MKTKDIVFTLNMSGVGKLAGVAYLAPCPFCGEAEKLELFNSHTAYCWIECSNCGAEMHGQAFAGKEGEQERRHFVKAAKSAQDAWNRREPHP